MKAVNELIKRNSTLYRLGQYRVDIKEDRTRDTQSNGNL